MTRVFVVRQRTPRTNGARTGCTAIVRVQRENVPTPCVRESASATWIDDSRSRVPRVKPRDRQSVVRSSMSMICACRPDCARG
jgi:hypothetical protein